MIHGSGSALHILAIYKDAMGVSDEEARARPEQVARENGSYVADVFA